MECYVCHEEQGKLVSSSCECTGMRYHERCVVQLELNRCPSCSKVDVNRPSMRYWRPELLHPAFVSLACSLFVLFKMHVFMHMVMAVHAYALRVFPAQLVHLLLPWFVHLFYIFTFKVFNITAKLSGPQMGLFSASVVLLYAFMGEDPVLRLQIVMLLSAAYVCGYMGDHVINVYFLRREHLDANYILEEHESESADMRVVMEAILFFGVVNVLAHL